MRPYCVAVLDKGVAIACGRRLVWTHLGGSESTNINLLEYKLRAGVSR